MITFFRKKPKTAGSGLELRLKEIFAKWIKTP